MKKRIPFNVPYMTGKELKYISLAHKNGMLAGDGPFTEKCSEWLCSNIRCKSAMLTHSATAALEMAAILANIKSGDEIILPSFTFVSTANAFVLRGGIPVFIDIRPDTLNIDERLIEAAITSRTKVIVPVHYAGVGCDMDAIMDIAARYNLLVIEDAAHGILAEYKGRKLGSIGHLAVLSFHETKNIISGEGGALLINDNAFVDRAEVIRDKGTNRREFYRGQIDKYTWVDIGSSYLPGELIAAFLFAQMEEATSITEQRMSLWNNYHSAFADLERSGKLRRPVISDACQHNAHMYYILLPSLESRVKIIEILQKYGIDAVFHYVPLHSSPAGQRFGRVKGSMQNTEHVSDCVLRLPLWVGMDVSATNEVVKVIEISGNTILC